MSDVDRRAGVHRRRRPCAPAARMRRSVRCRCGDASACTVTMSAPASRYQPTVSSTLSIMRWTSSGLVAIFLSAATTGGPMVRFGHEVAVHHVDVDEVGAPGLDELDRLGEPREVGREDRRGDQNAVGHGAPPRSMR